LQAAAGSPINLVGGNRVRGYPFAAGVLVEVVARIKRLVGQIGIEVLQFRLIALISGETRGGANRGGWNRLSKKVSI
jgi:hypothetical protein